MTNDFPHTVMITGARAPVAVHLGRLFSGAGIRVVFADTFAARISTTSKANSGFVQLPSPRFEFTAYQQALRRAVTDYRVQAIVPTCEEVFYLAQADLPVPVIAPGIPALVQVHNKFAFLQIPRAIGLPVPETQLLQSTTELADVSARSRDLVFKPVWSRFASRVLIRPDVAALSAIKPTPPEPWVAQQFIEGQEVSVYAMARHGQLVAMAAYRSLYRAGPGAGICFELDTGDDVNNWVQAFAEHTQWNGQVSFDMIRTPDGKLLPLECNPRATSGLHFFRDPIQFAEAFWHGVPTEPDVVGLQASKLAMWIYALPKAVRTGRLSRFAQAIHAAQDILDWPDDPGPKRAQLRTVASIARIALRDRISLQKASTYDIEWNGQDYNNS